MTWRWFEFLLATPIETGAETGGGEEGRRGDKGGLKGSGGEQMDERRRGGKCRTKGEGRRGV